MMNSFAFLSKQDDYMYTLSKAKKQPDQADFVTTIEKKVITHKKNKRWIKVRRNLIKQGTKIIKFIQLFKCKRDLLRGVFKCKARICHYGGM